MYDCDKCKACRLYDVVDNGKTFLGRSAIDGKVYLRNNCTHSVGSIQIFFFDMLMVKVSENGAFFE